MVASSRHERIAVALALALLAGCSVGEGQGEIGGEVVAAGYCNLDRPDYELRPTFFGGEVTENQLNIRIQRGSRVESFADGLMLQVLDLNEVKSQRIGLPIPLTGEDTALVQIIFYLNASCDSGFPNELRRRPVAMEAVAGSITFDAIYAPDIDAGATQTAAVLTDVRFVDAGAPDQQNATLNGSFSFFYQRGSPAQRFP